jgi:hypothetical protein
MSILVQQTLMRSCLSFQKTKISAVMANAFLHFFPKIKIIRFSLYWCRTIFFGGFPCKKVKTLPWFEAYLEHLDITVFGFKIMLDTFLETLSVGLYTFMMLA